MLVVPSVPEYGWMLDSHAGRVTTSKGVAVTPGNNTKGSYAQVIAGASVVHDVWAIEVWVHSNAASATARDLLVDIGLDPAGGTSYTVAIPDLLGAYHNNMTGGVPPGRYFFPLFIPAGTSIGARASVNNATVGAPRVFVRLYGKPKYPELTKSGSVVQAIGAVAASSRGTTITSGAVSEGSWTSLGTVTRQAWWWQVGAGINDSVGAIITYGIDVSAGSAGGDTIVLNEAYLFTSSSETGLVIHPPVCAREVAAGSTVYGRMQCSGTPDTGLSLIVYALS